MLSVPLVVKCTRLLFIAIAVQSGELLSRCIPPQIQPLLTLLLVSRRGLVQTSQFRGKELLNVLNSFSDTFKANHFHRIAKQCSV